MPSVVSVAWVEGGRVRGFGRMAEGGTARVRVVVAVAAAAAVAAAERERDRRESSGLRIEVRIMAIGIGHLAGVARSKVDGVKELWQVVSY